jgi:hypothetical protein
LASPARADKVASATAAMLNMIIFFIIVCVSIVNPARLLRATCHWHAESQSGLRMTQNSPNINANNVMEPPMSGITVLVKVWTFFG